MITRIVKMEIRPSEVENYKNLIKSIQDKIRQVDGCLSVSILNDKKLSTRFFSYSTWETEEDLENYRNSEFFRNVWKEAKLLFDKDAQVWTVEDAFE